MSTTVDEFVPTMQTIVVDKKILLEVLTANRTTHINEYKMAVEGYEEKVKEELAKAVKQAKAGDYESWRRLSYDLTKPSNYEKSYDLAIKKMELSQHDQVHLSDGEFKQYVMDEWQWSEQFSTSTMMYSGGGKK